MATATDAQAPEVTVTRELITCEIAQKYLECNIHNRPLRDHFVIQLALDMIEGNWVENAETIKFDWNGALSDGQHRLAAVCEAGDGVTIPFWVARGLPPEAQETVDTGVTRKFSDVLTLRDEKYAIHLAAIVRKVAYWSIEDHDAERDETGHRRRLSNHVLLRCLDDNPELRAIAKRTSELSKPSGLPGSVMGLCWWLFSKLEDGERDAEHFFSRLASDLGHEEGDPIRELRRTLLKSQEVRGDRNQTYLAAITIKAWNAYRRGESIRLLKFSRGGAMPESFPIPV